MSESKSSTRSVNGELRLYLRVIADAIPATGPITPESLQAAFTEHSCRADAVWFGALLAIVAEVNRLVREYTRA